MHSAISLALEDRLIISAVETDKANVISNFVMPFSKLKYV
jgi:hypothetical protein